MIPNDYQSKVRDIRLAAFIACHTSTQAIDHLTNILNHDDFCSHSNAPGTNTKLHLHRTKCTALITDVLEPAILQEIREEIGDQPYSILLDESTDVSESKLMAYCARYYNLKLGDMITDFLGFSNVIATTAEALYDNFINFIASMGLDLNKLVGLGTDGASNLCGCHNSLFTKLKEKIPNLILIKCICHSLHLCAKKAMTCLPSCLEFLIKETHNWFARSPGRWHVYAELYRLENNGSSPQKLPKLAATRWLSLESSIKSVASQWKTLKKYFNNANNDRNFRDEGIFKVRMLADLFNDESNCLYILFLQSTLFDVNVVNREFQAANAEIVVLYDDLFRLLVQIARKIIKPSFLRNFDFETIKRAIYAAGQNFGDSLLNIDDVAYGDEFTSALQSMSIQKEKVIEVKKRCRDFLKSLCEQLIERIPHNLKTIKKLSVFSPQTFFRLCQSSDVLPVELLPNKEMAATIKRQWDKLLTYSFADVCGPNSDSNVSSVVFWTKVGEMTNAVGEHIFLHLSKFVLLCLSIPVSNAVVERVFSIMNTVKHKLRNSMKLKALNAILRTRLYFSNRKLCCSSFAPSKKMVQLHCSNMYNDNKKDNGKAEETFENIFDEMLMVEEITFYD